MTKVDTVKEKIIETSLYLFNTNGITRTSIQDIMTATELPKGSIYRRFKNKEEIVLAAYDKSGEIMWSHFHKAMENKKTAIDKSLQFSLYIKMQLTIPPIAGGCPLLNSAIGKYWRISRITKSSSKRL